MKVRVKDMYLEQIGPRQLRIAIGLTIVFRFQIEGGDIGEQFEGQHPQVAVFALPDERRQHRQHLVHQHRPVVQHQLRVLRHSLHDGEGGGGERLGVFLKVGIRCGGEVDFARVDLVHQLCVRWMYKDYSL